MGTFLVPHSVLKMILEPLARVKRNNQRMLDMAWAPSCTSCLIELAVAADVRAGVLRRGDDALRGRALRHGPLRYHLPRHAAPGRLHHRSGHRHQQDGARPQEGTCAKPCFSGEKRNLLRLLMGERSFLSERKLTQNDRVCMTPLSWYVYKY